MSKFNKTTTQKARPDSVNMAGGVSYSRDDVKKEIASVILNTMLNGDSYYESEKDRLARIEALVSDKEIGEFVAKTAVYARNEGNLRSVSHFLATLLAENVKGEPYLRPAFKQIIVRPDDALEIVALWNSRNPGKMIPNSLRRSIKDVLEEKFDFYQLRKYLAKNNNVKLRDIIKLARPNPEIWWDKFGENYEKNYDIIQN